MIQLQGIQKGYGEQILFEDLGFQVGQGERIGISGRNGHGKSTLFKIILGEEYADAGRVEIPKGYTIGHLQQHFHFKHATVHEEACAVLPEHEGGWKEEHLADEILGGLGFTESALQADPRKLSGGFQVRLNLARALLAEPRMLLLDEPTNYLDITSTRWLERFLRGWKGEMMIITHDRSFMDAVCTHVVGIHRRKCRKVQGSVAKLWETILADEEVVQRTVQNDAKKREQLEQFIRRFRAQANKAKAVQSRVKALARAEGSAPQELGADNKDLDFAFSAAEFPGKRVLQVENVSFRYGDDAPWLVEGLSFELFKGDRVAIIGPNGRGKTTLLNLIAGELRPVDGGVDKNPNVQMAYFGQTNVNRLDMDRTVEEEIMATLDIAKNFSRGRARGLAGLMMFEGDAALKKVKVLSGGERSRVLLAKILATPCNLLLLDEPTNHLDMESVEALTEACEEFPGALLLVTHDEDILSRLATRLVIFDGGEAFTFDGTYDEFLERVGWAEERTTMTKALPVAAEVAPAVVAKVLPVEKVMSKEDRAARAKAIDERNKMLKPLEKRVSDLERKIEQSEAKTKELEAALITAAEATDGARIASISQEMGALEKARDSFYWDLEIAMQDVDNAKAKYAES